MVDYTLVLPSSIVIVPCTSVEKKDFHHIISSIYEGGCISILAAFAFPNCTGVIQPNAHKVHLRAGHEQSYFKYYK